MRLRWRHSHLPTAAAPPHLNGQTLPQPHLSTSGNQSINGHAPAPLAHNCQPIGEPTFSSEVMLSSHRGYLKSCMFMLYSLVEMHQTELPIAC